MNIHIENLDGTIDNENLERMFSPFGQVRSAEIIRDESTGASMGFGYVEMEDHDALAAIIQLNQSIVYNLAIRVHEAPPETSPGFKHGTSLVNIYRFQKN